MRSRMNKGFTLIEMLIVVAIIAILVAIAIPTFSARLSHTKEVTCMANRRNLYGEVMVEHIVNDRPCAEVFAGRVGAAGKCPCNGTYTWEDRGDNGAVKCSYHNDAGIGAGSETNNETNSETNGTGNNSQGGGSQFAAPLQGTASGVFDRGTVLKDATGTCVLTSGGTWLMQNAYLGGMTVSDFVQTYPESTRLVDPDVIEDFYAESIPPNSICYRADNDTYYYVPSLNPNETERPQGNWIALFK